MHRTWLVTGSEAAAVCLKDPAAPPSESTVWLDRFLQGSPRASVRLPCGDTDSRAPVEGALACHSP